LHSVLIAKASNKFDDTFSHTMYAGLVVLRRNFAKLCYCLPSDHKKTLTKIKRTAVVPEGLEYQLATLPTAELANCNILAAMIRPLRKEFHLVGFCDSVENLAESVESRKIIGDLRFGKAWIVISAAHNCHKGHKGACN